MALTEELNKRLIKNVDVFKALCDEDLNALTSAACELYLTPLEYVFQQNDGADAFYIIKAGVVRILRGSRVMAQLSEGEIFGEMGVLDEKPRAASAQAASNLVLLSISKNDLLSIIGERKSVEMKIRRKILERHTANIAKTFHHS